MKIKHLLLGTILAAVAGLAVSATFSWNEHQDAEQTGTEASCDTNVTKGAAAWKQVYSTADGLIDGVDTIVMAEAVSILPSRIAVSDGSRDELPFELVAFRVSSPFKDASKDGLIYVERVGGLDSKGRPINIDYDGGSFAIGKSYLLFLKRQEDGPFYYQVNDQGRYDVIDNELIPVGETEGDEVKEFFKSRTSNEALEKVMDKLKSGKGRK